MGLNVATDQRLVAALPLIIDNLDIGFVRVEILGIYKGAHHLAHVAAVADTLFDEYSLFFSVFKHGVPSPFS